MGTRGVHFAITAEQRAGLESHSDDQERICYVQEVIENAWDHEFLKQTDKAWDAIHRSLSEWPADTPNFYPVPPEHGAYALPEDHGTYPLKLAVLGGKRLQESEYDYFIRLVEPNEVIDLVPALKAIDEDNLRARYFKHCKGAWPEYGEEDFEYTWEYFEMLRDFFERMSGQRARHHLHGQPVTEASPASFASAIKSLVKLPEGIAI